MIVAIVRFLIPASIDQAAAAQMFSESAPRYQNIPGLRLKHYLYSQGCAGGVYYWDSREAAERFYTDDWRDMITRRYGAEPELQYFDSPVSVDNRSGEIHIDQG